MKVEINFSITESAASELKKALEGQGSAIRVSVVSSGCSGASYGLGVSETEDFDPSSDVVEEVAGITVMADKKSAFQLDGVVLDWYEGEDGSGFKFKGPPQKSCCRSGGCGS